MTSKTNAAVGELQRRPVASLTLRTGGLIGAVTLGGLLVACGSGTPDVGAAVAAQTKTVAERHFIFERLDHSAVNQHSTANDSDLPGASIAAYEINTDPVDAPAAARHESGSVRSAR